MLPPSIVDDLRDDRFAPLIHRVVERLDLGALEADSSEQGRPGYPPQLFAECLVVRILSGMTSRWEQRIHEDLGIRLLAGSLKPDHWTLNEFRGKHPGRLNDIFTQVVEAARKMGMGRLGRVAVDSTRISANASTAATRWSNCVGSVREFGSGSAVGRKECARRMAK